MGKKNGRDKLNWKPKNDFYLGFSLREFEVNHPHFFYTYMSKVSCILLEFLNRICFQLIQYQLEIILMQNHFFPSGLSFALGVFEVRVYVCFNSQELNLKI